MPRQPRSHPHPPRGGYRPCCTMALGLGGDSFPLRHGWCLFPQPHPFPQWGISRDKPAPSPCFQVRNAKPRQPRGRSSLDLMPPAGLTPCWVLFVSLLPRGHPLSQTGVEGESQAWEDAPRKGGCARLPCFTQNMAVEESGSLACALSPGWPLRLSTAPAPDNPTEDN